MPSVPKAIATYWNALAAADGAAMAACYSKDARFHDEVFHLQGDEVGAMWRMLFAPGNPVQVTTHPLAVQDDGTVTGRWEAVYAFPATGRRVHNTIDSTFKAQGGRIVDHRDRFSFYRWSHQALGPLGLLLGWTPLVKNKVRGQAMARLRKTMGGGSPQPVRHR